MALVQFTDTHLPSVMAPRAGMTPAGAASGAFAEQYRALSAIRTAAGTAAGTAGTPDTAKRGQENGSKDGSTTQPAPDPEQEAAQTHCIPQDTQETARDAAEDAEDGQDLGEWRGESTQAPAPTRPRITAIAFDGAEADAGLMEPDASIADLPPAGEDDPEAFQTIDATQVVADRHPPPLSGITLQPIPADTARKHYAAGHRPGAASVIAALAWQSQLGHVGQMHDAPVLSGPDARAGDWAEDWYSAGTWTAPPLASLAEAAQASALPPPSQIAMPAGLDAEDPPFQGPAPPVTDPAQATLIKSTALQARAESGLTSLAPQIQQALMSQGSTIIEIDTGAEGFGTLRISVLAHDSAVQIALLSGRPEMLELIRRSMALLFDDLATMGFDTIRLQLHDKAGARQDGAVLTLSREKGEREVWSDAALRPGRQPHGMDLRL